MPLGPLLFVTFLAVPLVEVAVFVRVGGWLGLWPTLLACVTTAVVGSFVIRLQGVDVARRTRARLEGGVMPLAEGLDGLCLVVAGLLLVTPGFFTDALGGLLLVPAVRRALYRRLAGRLTGMPAARPGAGAPSASGGVIDGDFEVLDADGADVPPPRGRWDRGDPD